MGRTLLLLVFCILSSIALGVEQDEPVTLNLAQVVEADRQMQPDAESRTTGRDHGLERGRGGKTRGDFTLISTQATSTSIPQPPSHRRTCPSQDQRSPFPGKRSHSRMKSMRMSCPVIRYTMPDMFITVC